MNITTLISELKKQFPNCDVESLQQIYDFADRVLKGQKAESELPYIQHALGTALLLAELRLDPDSVAASLLHDVIVVAGIPLKTVQDSFGEDIAKLVEGVTQLSRVTWEKLDKEKVNRLQKMFLAMADDVRVVIIKLAEQLDIMRRLKSFSPEDQTKIAKEALNIFSPLANKLGIRSIKRELEDLSLKYLEPEKYAEIVGLLAESKESRERIVADALRYLSRRFEDHGIRAEIFGRSKHIYSIYNKIRATQRDFSSLYDLHALRIIVESVEDCYQALDVIHAVWLPVLEEFDDYIAQPKTNNYQALHTTVIGPRKKPLEIQIRTQEMHQLAEFGVASHWRYKEKAGYDPGIEAKISYLRLLLEWQQELAESKAYKESLKTPPFSEYVYVFTPKGDIFDLLKGSTPVDFAYRVHTNVGHRCRGAKVNGKLVSLDYKLQNGDRVEIIKTKEARPSRDWLNPRLRFVYTPRIKQKIRQWFRSHNRISNISRGRDVLDRELKRLGLKGKNYEDIALLFNYDKPDDFFESVGYGDLRVHHLKTKLSRYHEDKVVRAEPETVVTIAKDISQILVRGDTNYLTRIAQCCRPLPGDEIVGYVTKGRGVTIHRKNCHNIQRQFDEARLIEVEWGQGKQSHNMSIRIEALNAKKILKEMATIVENEDARIVASHLSSRQQDAQSTIQAMLEIASNVQLNRILNKINALPSVIEAKKQTH
jgi:guanosine-3',5'-bis(diphosphate) 3'-pyrophosphohydrolase